MRDKLSTLKVQTLKKVGAYADGGGLYLRITRPGYKLWTFRYQIAGRAREMTLGPVTDLGLAEARDLADAARRLARDGRDPIEVRRQSIAEHRLEELRLVTFAQASEQFLQTDAVQRLANDKHRKQWRSTIEEACKTIGALPLAEIDSAVMLKTLLPVWQRAPETGSRLRGRLERVFAWALAHKLYTGTNPAALDVLRDALPAKPKQKHHAALRYAELPAFMIELRKRESISARALEFTILTAARTSEAIGATWSELDLEAKLWTIPAARMKAKRDHRAPLSDRAVELLRNLPAPGESAGHVFINGGGKPLSNMALLELLKGMAPGVTTHGFRSSFSDWAHDRMAYAPAEIELALAHVVGNKVRRLSPRRCVRQAPPAHGRVGPIPRGAGRRRG